MDIVYYYLVVGFLMNLIPALLIFYQGLDKGYVRLPHPMIFFMTIFSWPLTLWTMIERVMKGKNDE